MMRDEGVLSSHLERVRLAAPSQEEIEDPPQRGAENGLDKSVVDDPRRTHGAEDENEIAAPQHSVITQQ